MFSLVSVGMSTQCLKPQERKLRLRPRSCKGSPSSLFARLSPSVAAGLHKDALASLSKDTEESGWSVAAREGEPVQFLPLSVTFGDNVTICVSYNGGGIASDVHDAEEEILDLPNCLVPEAFSAENSEVRVEAIPFIQDADTLHVEPLTCEDWELLETAAAFLEGGELLSQVSLVYAGQTLPLWVGGKDAAWIRILPGNFGTPASEWPAMAETVTGDTTTTSSRCLRLVQDTRIVVAPKPRRKNEPKLSPPLRVLPTRQDYSQPANQLSESMGKKHVTTSPGTVVVHPSSKLKIPGLNSEDTTVLATAWNVAFGPSSEDAKRTCVLQVIFSDDIPEQHIAVHGLTRSRLDVVALVDSVFLRMLPPIEVAKRSNLVCTLVGKPTKVILKKVKLIHVLSAERWRYPSRLKADVSWRRLMSPADVSILATEPVEDGSFLFVPTPNGEGQALYQATFTESGEEAHISRDNRSFVSRQELAESYHLLAAAPSNAHVITDFVPSLAYELHSRSHLLNLLPEESCIPAALRAATNGEPSMLGDAIICGAIGSGKTHTALVLAAVARFQKNNSTFYLDCKRLKEGQSIRMKDILWELNRLFHDALMSCGGSLIILDDLDELCPNLEEENSRDGSAQSHQVNPVVRDQAKLIGDSVRTFLEAESRTKSVSVIITSGDQHSILPSILEARPFTRVVAAPDLTAPEREYILRRTTAPGSDTGDQKIEEAFKSWRIGRKTDTFRPRDLQVLASKARHRLQGSSLLPTPKKAAACVRKVLETFMPLRQISVAEGGDVGAIWSDIGGLFEVKDILTSTILNPARYRRIYERTKVRLPRGIMVFGSVGCGKSYLIPALAKKCGFSLVTCKGPELLDRYIGASESKVRDLFARAAASSPSILFFDEIDALAPKRGSDRTGVTDRVVNQLLTLLDGVEDSNAKGLVYVVAATSRPDIIDPALLRPGRLEKHIYVGSPQSEEEYADLILKIASRYAIEEELLENVSSGRYVQQARSLIPHFDRLSCADFKAAFDTAQLSAIHDILEDERGDENVIVRTRHITEALSSTRPSLPERDYKILMRIYQPFRKRDIDVDVMSSDKDISSQNQLRTSLR